MMWFDQPTEPCCVCAEEIVDKHFAECLACLKPFHLRMTENAPDKKDCGTVEVNDETWALEFTCEVCYVRLYPSAVR